MLGTSKYIDYGFIEVTTSDPDYLPDNLKVYSSSTVSYRTTNITENHIIIDMLAAITNPRLFLYNTNFTDVIIQGNSVNDFALPPFDSGVLTIDEDPDHFIYKYLTDLGDTFNYRYMKITIPAQTPIDNATYFEIGVMGIPNAIEDFQAEPLSTFEHPLGFDTQVSENDAESDTGRVDPRPKHWIPISSMTLNGRFLNNLANRKKVPAVFGHPLRPVIFLSLESEFAWEFYLMIRGGAILRNAKTSATGRTVGQTLRTIL